MRSARYLNLLLFGAGLLLAIAATLALQLLPDPALAISQLRGGVFGGKIAGSLSGRFASQLATMLIGGLAGFQNVLLVHAALPAVILHGVYTVLSLTHLSFRRSVPDHILLAAWGISLLAYMVIMSGGSSFYAVLWSPFAALTIGAAAAGGLQSTLAVLRRVSPVLLVMPLIAAGLGTQIFTAVETGPFDYRRYEAEIRALVPPDTSVLGNAALWFALHDRNDFVADWYFAQWSCAEGVVMTPEMIATLITRLNVEYVVDSGFVDTLPMHSCAAFWPLTVPQDYSACLQEACTPVGEVSAPHLWHGLYTFQRDVSVVYRCAGPAP